MKTRPVLIAILLLSLLGSYNRAAAQGTAFTYHGELSDSGGPLNGFYDLTFTLFDALTAGNQVPLGGPNPNLKSNVQVNGGLFTVTLDFGSNAFTGGARWLEIAVHPHAGGATTTLSPRQQLTPSPYAIYAANAGVASSVANNSVTGANIQNSTITANNIAAGQVVKSLNGLSDAVTLSAGPNITLTPSGNNMQISAPSTGGWGLTGNNGTTPGVNFLGTTDNQPLEMHVGGLRVMRFEPAQVGLDHTVNVIGGSVANSVAAGTVGATVAGGGNYYFVNSQPVCTGNTVAASFGSIGGGVLNSIPANAVSSTIAGGYQNTASGNYSTVGGGKANTASGGGSVVGGGGSDGSSTEGNLASGAASTIGGGLQNTNAGLAATVGGGAYNYASGQESTVAGGTRNLAIGYLASIGGGYGNSVSALAGHATIAGGSGNTAYGVGAAIPGGTANIASGENSFAAGSQAHANDDGSFVWADSSSGFTLGSQGNNTFIVRAAGGIWLGANSAPSITAGRFINTSTGGYLSTGGAWVNSSDRKVKENFQQINNRQILAEVVQLPITRWNYKTEGTEVRHLGPVAQDFRSAFGLGQDDQHIATVDESGVALAAIQGLNQKLEQKVMEKDGKIAELEQRLSELERTVSAMRGH